MTNEPLEIADAKSKFFDYCLVEYPPKFSFENKLTSVNILKKTFEAHNCNPDFINSMKKLRSEIGENKTIWGYKKSGNKFAWEYYFYNYNKEDPNINIKTILSSFNNYFKFDRHISENTPYFMFSIDIIPDFFKTKKLNGVHLYFQSEDRAGGLSYMYDDNSIKKENHYTFFDAKTELIQIKDKIKNTPIIDFEEIKLNKILLPELFRCKTICIANKLESDCIYYCGIDINQFVFFLKNFDYPKEIISFIEINKGKMDHLQFDVGFDYNMINNELNITKSGFYGSF